MTILKEDLAPIKLSMMTDILEHTFTCNSDNDRKGYVARHRKTGDYHVFAAYRGTDGLYKQVHEVSQCGYTTEAMAVGALCGAIDMMRYMMNK